MTRLASVFALTLPLGLIWACGSTADTGNGSNTGAASGSGANGTGANAGSLGLGGDALNMGGEPSSGGGTTGTAGTMNGTAGTVAAELCGDEGCVCSNGLDDDEDGLIDGFDPECTGPYDNDEGSFATGIPGDNRDPKWQDCFFDGNSGAGDDGCRYHTDCLTGDKELDDPDCELTAACIEFCAPRTPNGCDCFGCCTVQLPGGGTTDILTGSDCSLDKVDDAKACPVCVKSADCGNTCGTCELCPGKTEADLPEECTPTGAGGAGSGGSGGGPSYTCDDGEQVCGPDLDPCALGRYCSLGCCIQLPPK